MKRLKRICILLLTVLLLAANTVFSVAETEEEAVDMGEVLTITDEKHAAYVGTTVRCLIDGTSDDPRWALTARTPGNRLVRLKGDPGLMGQFINVRITGSNTWALYGEAE